MVDGDRRAQDVPLVQDPRQTLRPAREKIRSRLLMLGGQALRRRALGQSHLMTFPILIETAIFGLKSTESGGERDGYGLIPLMRIDMGTTYYLIS